MNKHLCKINKTRELIRITNYLLSFVLEKCVSVSLAQRFAYFVLFFFFSINNAFSATATIDNNYNFGVISQIAPQASFVIGTDSLISSTNNLTQSSSVSVGQITVTSDKNGDGVTLSGDNTSVQLQGCTITFSNITPSINGFTLNPGQGKERTITFGVSVNIDGFCEAGSYTESIITINISASKTGSSVAVIPFSIQFNQYIYVQELQTLNFGSIFANDTGGEVTVYNDGRYSSQNFNVYDSASAQVGRFSIKGLNNRTVHISFTNAVLYSGENSMDVININADVGTDFEVGDTDPIINIGGTLLLNPSQPPGVYNGTYTITLTY